MRFRPDSKGDRKELFDQLEWRREENVEDFLVEKLEGFGWVKGYKAKLFNELKKQPSLEHRVVDPATDIEEIVKLTPDIVLSNRYVIEVKYHIKSVTRCYEIIGQLQEQRLALMDAARAKIESVRKRAERHAGDEHWQSKYDALSRHGVGGYKMVVAAPIFWPEIRAVLHRNGIELWELWDRRLRDGSELEPDYKQKLTRIVPYKLPTPINPAINRRRQKAKAAFVTGLI